MFGHRRCRIDLLVFIIFDISASFIDLFRDTFIEGAFIVLSSEQLYAALLTRFYSHPLTLFWTCCNLFRLFIYLGREGGRRMNSLTGSSSVFSAPASVLLLLLTEGTTLLPATKDILIVLPGPPHPDITSSSSSTPSSSSSSGTCRDSLWRTGSPPRSTAWPVLPSAKPSARPRRTKSADPRRNTSTVGPACLHSSLCR